jgi:hypothetical protein
VALGLSLFAAGCGWAPSGIDVFVTDSSVNDASGNPLPVPGATVGLNDNDTGGFFTETTNAAGEALFLVDTGHSLSIGASADGFQDTGAAISAPPPGTGRRVALSLKPNKPHLYVTVLDGGNNNQPLAGANVQVTDANGNSVAQGQTNASGVFLVTTNAGTTYSVSATGTSSGGQSESARDSIAFPQHSTNSQVLTLTLTPPSAGAGPQSSSPGGKVLPPPGE